MDRTFRKKERKTKPIVRTRWILIIFWQFDAKWSIHIFHKLQNTSDYFKWTRIIRLEHQCNIFFKLRSFQVCAVCLLFFIQTINMKLCECFYFLLSLSLSVSRSIWNWEQLVGKVTFEIVICSWFFFGSDREMKKKTITQYHLEASRGTIRLRTKQRVVNNITLQCTRKPNQTKPNQNTNKNKYT